MCTVVCTVRAATFSVILRGIAGAEAAGAEAATAEAVAEGANKAMAEWAKSELRAGAGAAAAAAAAVSKHATAFKDDKNAAVVVLLIGGTPAGVGACTPSRSPCRRCVCFRCTC